jgi:hydrocephalus-inducing protein
MPNGNQLVQVSFTPSTEKNYQHRFPIKIAENSKPFYLELKGTGISINLEFTPLAVDIGPVFPYAHDSSAILEVHNPSPYSTELISLNFDRRYELD